MSVDHSTLAQWVSAVGSIAAILSGFILNWLNQRRARREAKEQASASRADRLQSVKIAAETVAFNFSLYREKFSSGDPNEMTKWGGLVAAALEEYRACRTVVESIDIHELRATEVVRAVLSLRTLLASAVGFAESQYAFFSEHHASGGMALPSFRVVMIGGANNVIECADRLTGAVDQALLRA